MAEMVLVPAQRGGRIHHVRMFRSVCLPHAGEPLPYSGSAAA
jgi:hypothetical protein